ncbi:hypothetical protein LTS13_010366 [Exophiala xenobiotica]|nr:hypothetical protein LTS13_010366 [Exophiala xenobiotica]KAK5398922.1 hypothetical protein LTR79_003920 [Exophiala xenobiotica]KAK5421574.1 hypothetical protein LTR90_003064 [Exophiala xenobiotica]KAK5487058.1 hypothetical protein LTR26_005092 [Exophiala xenobiotica]KAK5520753.1 hypothetical protein LTR21_002445 [Exophiala xenobiotica]
MSAQNASQTVATRARAVSSTATTSISLCEGIGCRTPNDVQRSLCLSCGSTYCDVCWFKQGPHQPGKVGIDGLPHKKTDKTVYERLKNILQPPSDAQELTQLHIEDEDTTWFGIEKDVGGQPIFQDHGRYAALMAETKQPGTSVRYPQLVSFVGQTGAGKSTLIKMLVSLLERKLTGAGAQFRSPVVGSTKNDKSPTSGDVHLYIDPETAYGPLPMLYADCEGLEGGDTAPIASRLRETMRNQGHPSVVRRRLFSSRPRELVYAKTNTDARNREWAVKKVYPRLLYTFSDVVVFVLRNPRAFESSALRLLLEWASTSVESSINQPTLPHAIIVLNATSTEIDPDEWDVKTATERLLAHVEHAVTEVEFFRLYTEHWRKRHKAINNMADLIRCYYADITVVRIPTKGRYMLADAQINKLHAEILKGCDASFSSKMSAHMLSNTDELNSYLQAGFDHFTTEEDKPFNFVEVALKNNPIPRDFGDHILGLAAVVREVTEDRDGPKLFNKLSYMVASCIFIDCIRQRRPGKSQDLFDQFYSSSCTAALEHFCNKFWPCSYVSKKGRPCVNVKATHGPKGHQNAQGKIISSGPYQSRFSSFEYSKTWSALIKEYLFRFEKQLEETAAKQRPRPRDAVNPKDVLAYDLHHEHMQDFFRMWENRSASDFASPTTCFCCLMEVPQHPLPCGHVLCTECVKVYGRHYDRNSFVMEYCPLHRKQGKFSDVCVIHFKPDSAGVRVLTLDGGGIRGIVELEVLREVEQALGGRIPLLAFFDLIVGTSTGGIIALAIGVKQWSLNQCISEFVRLCDQAFTPRELQAPGLKQMTTLRHGSKYRTQPLRNALRQAFGNEDLYGGPKKGHAVYDTKVAVTATSGTGDKPVLLANYSRQEENEPSYKFEFPHRLRLWEAAAATSAAPPFFKPFDTAGKQSYLDGAIYYNNPVRVANHERRYLWPDVAENPPDIILSVGTGQNRTLIAEELLQEQAEQSKVRESKPKAGGKWAQFGEKLKTSNRKKPKNFQLFSKYFDVLVNRIDKILDAEREWQVFHAEAQNTGKSMDGGSRCIRVNLDLGKEPPALDAKTELTNLQTQVVQLLRSREYQNDIEQVAYRLVASTFYFIKDSVSANDNGTFRCSGRITCRFEGNSSEMRRNMRELGHLLRQQQIPGYQPFFTIKEQAGDVDSNKVFITESMIEDMIRRAEFRFDKTVEIEVPNQLTMTTIYLALYERRSFEPGLYPISGFPRCLVMEDSMNATRLDKRAELIRQRRYGALDVANDPKVLSPSEEALPGTATVATVDPDISDAATLVETNSSDGGVSVPSLNREASGEDKRRIFLGKSSRGSLSPTNNGKPAASTAQKQDGAAVLRDRDASQSGVSSAGAGAGARRTESQTSAAEAESSSNSNSGHGHKRAASVGLRRRLSLRSLRAKAHVAAEARTVIVDASEMQSPHTSSTTIGGGTGLSLSDDADSDGPVSDDEL